MRQRCWDLHFARVVCVLELAWWPCLAFARELVLRLVGSRIAASPRTVLEVLAWEVLLRMRMGPVRLYTFVPVKARKGIVLRRSFLGLLFPC